MGTVSARLPEDLEDALETYIETEHLDRSTAVRKLLAEGLDEWRVEHALTQLEAGEMSFSKAAEFADCSPWELARHAQQRDIRWVSGDHLADDLDAL